MHQSQVRLRHCPPTRFRPLPPPFPKRRKEPTNMDQLKTQLALVKQHSFWAMCLGILGVTVGSWWVSTSKLASEQSAQVSKIKGEFDGLKTVTGQQLHPNQTVI